MSHVTPASAALHSDLFSVRAQLQTVKGTDSARDGDVRVVKNRPEADVELHFQARLHVMNLVRGFHHQRSVIVEIDVAAVAAQEESERGSKFVVVGPHPEYRHRLGGEGEAGRPRRPPASKGARLPPHRSPTLHTKLPRPRRVDPSPIGWFTRVLHVTKRGMRLRRSDLTVRRSPGRCLAAERRLLAD